MGKLVDVYSNVKSPLDNEDLLKKIIKAYSESSRTDLHSDGLYNSLVKMNHTTDNSPQNASDREAFMVETYNQWMHNILSLDASHIKYLESNKGMDVRKLQQYFRSFGKVQSMDDVERLTSSPLFSKEVNGWLPFNEWYHIFSRYISGRTENAIAVKHRLYVGCQNQDMWKLAKLFKNKCEERKIPFYFKVGASTERDDKMVIYADTDNLENYINILQEIAREHPDIVQRCGEPPALTGRIDGWIGIGDEPNKSHSSYNLLRASIFEDAIEEAILNELRDFKGQMVTFNGKQIKFNDIFIDQATQYVLDKKLTANARANHTTPSKSNLSNQNLANKELKENVRIHLKNKIQKGLDTLTDVKDRKNELMSSNKNSIFTIPTQSEQNISIDTYDMDKIIKRMAPIMLQIDPTFIDKVKFQIQQRCKQNGIDDKFCFQEGTKQRFEQFDLAQSTKLNNQKTETINSIDIVGVLDSSLLSQKIELPNGAKIPAKQYIQEVVAPHIPSSGSFILKDGSQVSAKQYIEEFVFGEGQAKYQGNISKLLSETTKGNNGTIIVNGKQINAVDIVDNINPELMKKSMKLPNGVEVSAKQYIQEVVSDHIPSNGNFILKSNGSSISAQQFIEEAVMGIGQQKYNGDISALLENMTVANTGTITIKAKAKPPRGQVLQQEPGISQEKKEKFQAVIEAEENRKNQSREIAGRKKYMIQQVKESISKSKITSKEFNQGQHSLADKKEMFQLMLLGNNMTEEQKKRLEELQNSHRNNRTQQNSQNQDQNQDVEQ